MPRHEAPDSDLARIRETLPEIAAAIGRLLDQSDGMPAEQAAVLRFLAAGLTRCAIADVEALRMARAGEVT